MNEAQKDLSRRRQQRYREQQKRNATVTNVTQKRNATGKNVTRNATVLPANFGQDDCTCRHCQNNRAKGSPHTLNHGAHKLAKALSKKELNRVTLPGDVDYKGAVA